jgi:hypothetical protein
MTAGCYRAKWVAVSFSVLLAYFLLNQRPPIRLPGKSEDGRESGVCPDRKCRGVVRKRSASKYVCQKCGASYSSLPGRR